MCYLKGLFWASVGMVADLFASSGRGVVTRRPGLSSGSGRHPAP